MFFFNTSFLLSQSIEEDYTKVKSTICLKALKSGKVIDQGNNQFVYNATIIYEEKIYYLSIGKKSYKEISPLEAETIPNKVRCYKLNKME
tara:strand:+ start:878 stop:1147 length:270 start_codon:yes stop_codon:yes gene_type:complete